VREYRSYESVPPYGLTDMLAARVDALGLAQNLEELREHGYTVLRDVAPIGVTDRIRDAILRLVQQTEGRAKGHTAALLLGRDPVFETAVLNDKLMTIVEFMCGQGALLSQLQGSVRRQGEGFLGLHADQNWTPAPFPEHPQLITACWACDDFTEEGGATRIIPATHRHRRHPTPAEIDAMDGAVPIVCPRGSIAVWDGAVWHGNYPRRLPGERVVLHMTYSRIALRPLEDYSHLGQEFLDRNPPAMATLLGRTDVFGSTTPTSGGVDMTLFRQTAAKARGVYRE
jgi:hypothetical protein